MEMPSAGFPHDVVKKRGCHVQDLTLCRRYSEERSPGTAEEGTLRGSATCWNKRKTAEEPYGG